MSKTFVTGVPDGLSTSKMIYYCTVCNNYTPHTGVNQMIDCLYHLHIQVSLTGVSMPGGGIAVPVPISLINSNSGVLQNQGIFVSSLSGMPAANTVSGTMAGNAATNVSRQVRIVCSLWLTVLCLACCLLYCKW